MTTTAKNHKKQRRKNPASAELSQGTYQLIPADKIVINSNYRGAVYKKDLQEFAAELKLRGIISPVTVRPLANGNFELVAGERRLKAAAIAGINLIPCMVKELSDEEVLEIQLSENLNRENTNPLKEAFAILQMQQNGKTFEEICSRMAKSKSFVYQRLQLAELDECFHPVFLANKITTAVAFKLAELSPNSQQQLYEEHFNSWDDENFKIGYHLETTIQNLRLDLNKANFSIRSKSLLPEAGACINCRYNSATLASLFPELNKEAICSNADCFQQKSLAHYRNLFNKALEKEQPQAIITNGNNEVLEKLIESNEAAQSLPVYNYYDVNILNEPEQPLPEDYENATDDDAEQRFDNAGFELAMTEYNEELEAIELAKQSGELKKGNYLRKGKIEMLWFGEHRSNQQRNSKRPAVTAKAVQEAIKSGVATRDLLLAEISRIQDREKRAMELDREKVQLKVHEAFKTKLEEPLTDKILTRADHVAQLFLLYESLDWNAKQKAQKVLFKDGEYSNCEAFYNRLDNLTAQEEIFLTRLAIAEKNGSQYPQQLAGLCCIKLPKECNLILQLSKKPKCKKHRNVKTSWMQGWKNWKEKLQQWSNFF